MRNMMLLVMMVLCLLMSCGRFVDGKNFTFAPLPTVNFILQPGPDGIWFLYDLSIRFVNIFFVPFEDVKDVLLDLFSGGGGEEEDIGAGNISTTQLDNVVKLATINPGYIVCLLFGILFILLVLVGGTIMCCCRFNDRCGGKYEQSPTRAESKWRRIMTAILLSFTLLMIVPCVFILVTNIRLTEVVEAAPTKLTVALDNFLLFADNVPKQMNFTTGEYSRVNETITQQLTYIDEGLGIPIRDRFRVMAEPTISHLNDVDIFLNDSVTAIDNSKALVGELKSANTDFQTALDAVANKIRPLQTNAYCSLVPDCINLANNVDTDLQLSSDITNIDLTDITKLGVDLGGYSPSDEIVHLNGELDDIPESVANESAKSTQDMTKELQNIKEELEDMGDAITPEMLDNIHDDIEKLKSDISYISTQPNVVAATTWANITVTISGVIILLICTLYLFGMLMGYVFYDPEPEGRDQISNTAGIFLMIGAGLSFIFSWIFMILVIVLFTAGGFSERYGCQTFRDPFEGLEFVDRLMENDPIIFSGEELKLFDIARSSVKDETLYWALKWNESHDLDELSTNITRDVKKSTTDLKNTVVDLTDIDVYTTETKNSLNNLKATGVENMQLTKIGDDARKGVESVNLVDYAAQLRQAAASLAASGTAVAEVATLNECADDIDAIKTTNQQPMTQKVVGLEANLTTVVDKTNNLNGTMDETKRVLSELDTNIHAQGPGLISAEFHLLGDDMEETVDSYLSWYITQIDKNVGRLERVFNASYVQWIEVGCDGVINSVGGIWWSLGWCVIFLIPAGITAIKLAKFYRSGSTEGNNEELMEEVEMHEYTVLPQQNQRPSSKLSLRPRSAKIHPSEYY